MSVHLADRAGIGASVSAHQIEASPLQFRGGHLIVGECLAEKRLVVLSGGGSRGGGWGGRLGLGGIRGLCFRHARCLGRQRVFHASQQAVILAELAFVQLDKGFTAFGALAAKPLQE